MTDFNLREQLIRRIRKLPESALSRLEEIIRELEQKQSTLVSESPTTNSDQSPQETALAGQSNVSQWPHAPVHRLSEHGAYIVTAGTMYKQHFFRGSSRLDFLERTLLELAAQYGWHVEAWAVFPNHYHFVAQSNESSGPLQSMLSQLHTTTASEINADDREPRREVWHNFWDTHLTIETSYLARLNYVHQNAVKHGLVKVANEYRWCSARWFERTATSAQVKTIYGFGISKVRVFDDF